MFGSHGKLMEPNAAENLLINTQNGKEDYIYYLIGNMMAREMFIDKSEWNFPFFMSSLLLYFIKYTKNNKIENSLNIADLLLFTIVDSIRSVKSKKLIQQELRKYSEFLTYEDGLSDISLPFDVSIDNGELTWKHYTLGIAIGVVDVMKRLNFPHEKYNDILIDKCKYVELSNQDVINKLTFNRAANPHTPIFQNQFKNVIQNLSADELKSFIMLVSGESYLPDDADIYIAPIRGDADYNSFFHTCNISVEIKGTLTEEEIKFEITDPIKLNQSGGRKYCAVNMYKTAKYVSKLQKAIKKKDYSYFVYAKKLHNSINNSNK